MGKSLKWILCVLIFFSLLNLVWAQTITLKSGETIEGKIIEENEKYLKLDFQGVELWYDRNEVASLGQDTSVPEKTANFLTPLPENSDFVLPINAQKGKSEQIINPQEATFGSSGADPLADLPQIPERYQKMIQSALDGN